MAGVDSAIAGLGQLQSAFERRTKNRLDIEEASLTRSHQSGESAKDRALKDAMQKDALAASEREAKIRVGPAYAELNFKRQQDQMARDALAKRLPGIEASSEASTPAGQLALGMAEGDPDRAGQAAQIFNQQSPEQLLLHLGRAMQSAPAEQRGELQERFNAAAEAYDFVNSSQAWYKKASELSINKADKTVSGTFDVGNSLSVIGEILRGKETGRVLSESNSALAQQISLVKNKIDLDEPLAPQLYNLEKEFGSQGFSAKGFRGAMVDYLAGYFKETDPDIARDPMASIRLASAVMSRLETGGNKAFQAMDKKGNVVDNNKIQIRLDLQNGDRAAVMAAKPVFRGSQKSQTPVADTAKPSNLDAFFDEAMAGKPK